MGKKVAVLAVNPVNGAGLFQYLEAFFENGVAYTVFAVAHTNRIRTNSGIALDADDVIANLKGRAGEYDALVFACGDAVPVFAQHASEPYNQDLMQVVREFAEQGKTMIGHCAAGLIFELAGVTEQVELSLHPLAQPAIRKGIVSGQSVTVCKNFYTAQDEHAVPGLIPLVLAELK